MSTMTTLNWDLYTMFLYLANAVMCIPEKYQEQVFQGMAHKILEWGPDVTREELREVMEKFGFELEEESEDE